MASIWANTKRVQSTIPFFLAGCRYPIGKGADIFISVWNLHHSPFLWPDPETFRPERFSERFHNPAYGDKWAGAELLDVIYHMYES